MENPQAQMPQGQPGMEQGQAPQQGGQDQQMQQLMQAVQQMIQQGAQPTDVAAELLGQQVPPEVIMQVFVQMGMPEQDAQMAIQEAMQGGQQSQNPGEEQMEGAASNPQEEAVEQEGAPMPPEMQGQPPMAFGGQPRRMLRKRAEGGGMDPQQELQSVMEQVQGMMQQGADARQVMEQIQAAAQQGQISPEVATQVMEQLSGMQQAENPQGSDMAMTEGSQDPQAPDANVAAPEASMMRFGGNLKKLMQKAYGGNAIPPTLDSKNYAQERANMFVTSVKNNAFKSTLDEEFPSLTGNQMAYGGNIPKAANGISMKDGKLTIDPTQYKTEAEYKAAVYDWNTNAANKDNQVTTEMFTQNKWTEQPDQNASYKYDPNTKQYVKQAPTQPNQGYYQNSPYVVSQSQINPVAYQNPMGNTLYDNLYMSANPWARMIAGSGNRMTDPRITGSNLPGGMNANQFLGAIGGVDRLTSGMTGTVGNQTWRLGEAEKFKEGSIWKGNRRKGVRYKIDWGDAAAFNTPAGQNPANATPAGPQNNPYEGNSTPMGPVGQIIDPAISADANLKPVLDAQGNQFISDGSNLTWNSGNMPTMPNQAPVNNTPQVTTPVTAPTASPVTSSNPITVANQNLVTPGQSNVQQPAAEVNAEDNSRANMTITNATDQGIRGVDNKGALVSQDYKPDRFDRQYMREKNRSVRRAARETKNFLNDEAAKTQVMPEVMQQAFEQQEQLLQPQSYGGSINPQDLANAVALINRAFGGMMPRAVDGLDLGSEDANGNKIPDYLEAANLPAANNQGPAANQGYIEESAGKKFNVDWNAAADVYATSGAKFANFMNRVGSYQGNQERELAKRSALNRPSDTYDTMEQGVYDQWGNFKPNDLNNQVLNPTDIYRQNQRQIYAYGGRLYEIGGEVELDDDEMQQLSAAGFKISRV